MLLRELNRNGGVESIERYMTRAKVFWRFLKFGRSGDKYVYNDEFYEDLNSIIQEYLLISKDNTNSQDSFILSMQNKYKMSEETRPRASPTESSCIPVISSVSLPTTVPPSIPVVDTNLVFKVNLKVKGLQSIQNFIAKMNCVDKMHVTVEGHEILSAKMLPNMIDSINTCLSFCYQDNPIDQWQKVVSLTISGSTHGMEV